MSKLKNLFNKKNKILKNKKGGLAGIIVPIFMLVVCVFVFNSAVHPTAGVIRTSGQNAGAGIVHEQTNIQTDFVATPMPEVPTY